MIKPTDIRILAVDDDEMLLEAIADLFRHFKFKVDTATGGNKAWEIFDEEKYKLVITDIRMPDGDGLELLSKIKQRKSTFPTMIVSGFTSMLYEEIYHSGSEGIFSKPFNSTTVKNAIQTCLLNSLDKWVRIPPKRHPLHLVKSGRNDLDLAAQKEVLFGRGGLFIAHSFALPARDTEVSFEINISEPAPQRLFGTGIVRWVANHGHTHCPAGVGIEIVSMDAANAAKYIEKYGQIIPLIPSPKK